MSKDKKMKVTVVETKITKGLTGVSEITISDQDNILLAQIFEDNGEIKAIVSNDVNLEFKKESTAK